ncbi:MAG: TonB-dependent receptor [Calditrichaeota bacterium]|nr:TonB-dependent receptor [Calditrichota bacterium]
MLHKILALLFIVFLVSVCASPLYAASSGKIVGIVKDAGSGDPLPGANIVIDGTARGTSTNLEGEYRLTKIPPGKYTLVITYIGYKKARITITVLPNRTINRDIQLEFEALKGEEVVVTAQLDGQARAINRQLSANTIVNVVSPDKIQELPDQNAAESLGRLPGISVQRNAGEGQKIVVRGLSPKFNSILVNGERIPSTDPEDRSVDLSMISPDVLAGIEVYKSLTPDMDADAVGGTVNFVIRKAPEGLKTNIRMQGGYNNHEKDYSPYKGSISLSNRFYGNKFGVLVTASRQRANRGSDILEASYFFKREKREGEERALIEVDKLNLGDRLEIRDRYSASAALDYDLKNGGILLSSFWGRTNRDEVRRRRRYNIEAYRSEYDIRDRQIDADLWTNSLSGHHIFPNKLNIDIDWRTSYSRTFQETPFSHYARFYELGAFKNSLIDDRGPELIPEGAENNLDQTFFKRSIIDGEKVDDRNFTAKIDMKLPFVLGKKITGYIKFGSKTRDKRRDRNKTRMQTDHFGINELGAADTTGKWDLTVDKKIRISNFIDKSFKADNFLNGAYNFGLGLDRKKINNFYYTYKNYVLGGKPFYRNDPTVDLEDYNAGEKITAAYLMAEINFGQRVSFLPGIRYERTSNDYSSIYGTPRKINESDYGLAGATDTTGVNIYRDFLPMVHLRYKALNWLDLRLAVTKSLSRPNYFNLVPWQRIEHLDQTIERGDPRLKHTSVWNYDAYLSMYNRYGLFTLGWYYKTMENIDYIRTARIQGGKYNGYTLTEPVNAEGESVIKGIELELQTNLKLLPSPFDGIVIYFNYSRIFSETFYPLLKVERGGPPFFRSVFIDTVRVGRLPGQADNLANLTLGYEKRGFSGRISMVYQGESLMTIGTREELDGFSDAFIRWDLAMQQKISHGFSLYFNLNNISNRSEGAFLGLQSYPTLQEFFGWTADLGVRYKF